MPEGTPAPQKAGWVRGTVGGPRGAPSAGRELTRPASRGRGRRPAPARAGSASSCAPGVRDRPAHPPRRGAQDGGTGAGDAGRARRRAGLLSGAHDCRSARPAGAREPLPRPPHSLTPATCAFVSAAFFPPAPAAGSFHRRHRRPMAAPPGPAPAPCCPDQRPWPGAVCSQSPAAPCHLTQR